ncbi:hypothetical protein HYQ44_017974 [Verticillium longisporum]|nr:hypothetical protein HYQ44_017974 [Verticillium longisporum]
MSEPHLGLTSTTTCHGEKRCPRQAHLPSTHTPHTAPTCLLRPDMQKQGPLFPHHDARVNEGIAQPLAEPQPLHRMQAPQSQERQLLNAGIRR